MRRNFTFAFEWSFSCGIFFLVVVEVTTTSLYCVLFLPFLSPQVCLFLLFIFFLSSLWARIFLKITYKAVLTFFSTVFFSFGNHSNSYFLHSSFHLDPHPTIRFST